LKTNICLARRNLCLQLKNLSDKFVMLGFMFFISGIIKDPEKTFFDSKMNFSVVDLTLKNFT